uniref:Uncharacterized protein n=1 Tax=Rhizophora mucronata TaxID=61149 RepID=A0A2P2QNX7_RHIMU
MFLHGKTTSAQSKPHARKPNVSNRCGSLGMTIEAGYTCQDEKTRDKPKPKSMLKMGPA